MIPLPSLAMSVDGIHPTTQAYDRLRQNIISHINTQLQSLRQLGHTQLRSTTPLLPTPNVTPSNIIYLPTLPNYVDHRNRNLAYQPTTASAATSITTPNTTTAAATANFSTAINVSTYSFSMATAATPHTTSAIRPTLAIPSNTPSTSHRSSGSSFIFSGHRAPAPTPRNTEPLPPHTFHSELTNPRHKKRRITAPPTLPTIWEATTQHKNCQFIYKGRLASFTPVTPTPTPITTQHKNCLFRHRGHLSSISKR